MLIIRSLSTAVAASGLPLERGGNSVVASGWLICLNMSNGENRQKADVWNVAYIFLIKCLCIQELHLFETGVFF